MLFMTRVNSENSTFIHHLVIQNVDAEKFLMEKSEKICNSAEIITDCLQNLQ